MKGALRLLDSEQIDLVNQAVEQAHKRTSARILPVIATSSGRYERAEDVVGLWAAALGLALIWMFLSEAPVGREWTLTGRVWRGGLLLILAAIAGGFVLGAILAMHAGWLRRLFVPRRKMLANVVNRAKQVYGTQLLRSRHDQPGELILVYISLCEKAVVVLTGEDLRQVLDAQQVNSIRKTIRIGLSSGRPCEMLCMGIARLAQLLAPHCPAPTEQAEPEPSYLTVLD